MCRYRDESKVCHGCPSSRISLSCSCNFCQSCDSGRQRLLVHYAFLRLRALSAKPTSRPRGRLPGDCFPRPRKRGVLLPPEQPPGPQPPARVQYVDVEEICRDRATAADKTDLP